MISILIAVLIFCVAVWLIGILPLPAGDFPLKTVLYVIAGLVLILYLLGYV